MNFLKSNLCADRLYCQVCRQTETGREWRTLIGRIYETECIDFPCPFGMPWIVDGQTFDPKAIKVETVVKLPTDYSALGEQVKRKEVELRELLPKSRIVIALDEVLQVERSGGCSSCNRRRVMRKLGEFVRTLPEEEKLIVSRVIGNPT